MVLRKVLNNPAIMFVIFLLVTSRYYGPVVGTTDDERRLAGELAVAALATIIVQKVNL